MRRGSRGKTSGKSSEFDANPATVGPEPTLGYVRRRAPCARHEGSERVDVARFGRGTDPAVRVAGARAHSQAPRPADRIAARPFALLARPGRPPGHCATG